MGPIRRGLVFAATFLSASPAWAAVCQEVRPNWDGTPTTAWGEMLVLLQTPFVLALIVATALVIRFRSERGGLAVIIGWSIATYLVAQWGGGNALHAAARQEGCIGSPALFISVAAALCIGVVLYTAPLPKRTKK